MIKSSNYLGGITGYVTTSNTITNCYNSGAIIGKYPGGISGFCKGAILNNCFNVGDIKSTNTEGVKAAGVINHFWGFNTNNLNQVYYLNNVDIAVAKYRWDGTLNYKGNAMGKENMCTQEFVNELNKYVDENSTEEIILSRWKYNEGEYPTFVE